MDNYSPIPWSMALVQNILARYETWSIFQPFKNFIRKRGLKFCVEYMAAEDLQTNFIDIGPVNKTMNMLSAYDGMCSSPFELLFIYIFFCIRVHISSLDTLSGTLIAHFQLKT